MAGIPKITGFDILAPVFVDSRSGPYDSVADALSGTSGRRVQGLVVKVIESGSAIEYMFRDGVGDSDLVRRPEGVTPADGYAFMNTTANRFQEVGSTVNISLSVSYKQNNSPNATSYRIYRNNVLISSSQNTIDTIVVSEGFVSYRAEVVAGSLVVGTADLNIQGVYPAFSGSNSTPNLTGVNLYNGIKKIIDTNGKVEVEIPDNNEFPWVAIHEDSDIKNYWANAELISDGSEIGSGEFFEAPISIPITSSGLTNNYTENYNVYVGTSITRGFNVALSNNPIDVSALRVTRNLSLINDQVKWIDFSGVGLKVNLSPEGILFIETNSIISAISGGGGGGYSTPEEVRDALASLSGANRLAVTAILNAVSQAELTSGLSDKVTKISGTIFDGPTVTVNGQSRDQAIFEWSPNTASVNLVFSSGTAAQVTSIFGKKTLAGDVTVTLDTTNYHFVDNDGADITSIVITNDNSTNKYFELSFLKSATFTESSKPVIKVLTSAI